MAKENYLLPLTIIVKAKGKEEKDTKKKTTIIASAIAGFTEEENGTRILLKSGTEIEVMESFSDIYRMANSHGVYHLLGAR